MITGMLDLTPDYLKYRLELLNPDALGNPLEHFGDEETGKESSRDAHSLKLCAVEFVSVLLDQLHGVMVSTSAFLACHQC